MGSPKDIDIAYLPPDKDGGCSILQHLHVLGRESLIPDRIYFESAARSDNPTRCCFHVFRSRPREFCREGEIGDSNARPCKHIGSGSESAIFDENVPPRAFSERNVQGRLLTMKDIGAELPFSIVLGVFNQISGRQPKKERGESQQHGKSGDENRAGSRNELFVALYLFLVFAPALALVLAFFGHIALGPGILLGWGFFGLVTLSMAFWA